MPNSFGKMSRRPRRGGSRTNLANRVGPVRLVYGDQTLDTYSTAEECKQLFPESLKGPSNPEVVGSAGPLSQTVTCFVNWDQVKRFILDRKETFELPPNDLPRKGIDENKFVQAEQDQENACNQVTNALMSRLNLPFHARLTSESLVNTLKYLFFHLRCGIFVKIKNNRLHVFAPFANKNYRNNWKDVLGLSPEKLDEYYQRKRKCCRYEKIIPMEQWWANGNMICNEIPSQIWGGHLVCQQRDMLIELCRTRVIPDVEFFINKRDHPQLKTDLSEPYDFIFDDRNRPLDQYKFESYAPILSFFVSENFADLPSPSSDDWEIATGRVFPPNGGDNYSSAKIKQFSCAWEEKVNTAFFRGSATGGGVSVETNQRLKIAQLSVEWESDSRYNRKNAIDGVPFLDAGITSFNVRDKKQFGSKMAFLDVNALGLKKASFVPMYEQARFKYIVYVEGHCAAARYGFLMKMGCVILKVQSSCNARDLWFFPMLREWEDHVPVKEDLSDVAEQIAWCKQNDQRCREIAYNAKRLYEQSLSKECLLDYYQLMLTRISERFVDDVDNSEVAALSEISENDDDLKEPSLKKQKAIPNQAPETPPNILRECSHRETESIRNLYQSLARSYGSVPCSSELSSRSLRHLTPSEYSVSVLPKGKLVELFLTQSGTFLKTPQSSKLCKMTGVSFVDKRSTPLENVFALAFINQISPLTLVIADLLFEPGHGSELLSRSWNSRYLIAVDLFSRFKVSTGVHFTLKFMRPMPLNTPPQQLLKEVSARSYPCVGLFFNRTRPQTLQYQIFEWHNHENQSDDNALFRYCPAKSPFPPPHRLYLDYWLEQAAEEPEDWLHANPLVRLSQTALLEHLEDLK